MTATDPAFPAGYIPPLAIWCVEWQHPDAPEDHPIQLAAFTTETSAREIMRQYIAEGWAAVELSINMINVFERVEDWQWNR